MNATSNETTIIGESNTIVEPNIYAPSRRTARMSRRVKLTFGGALKSELLKLWSLNSTAILLSIAIALMLSIAAVNVWAVTFVASIDMNTGKPLDEPRPVAASDIWSSLAGSSVTTALVIGIFGVMAITSEYTTSVIQSSLTANPRRGMFYIAKSLAVALFALAAGVVGALLAWGLTAVMTAGHDITPLKDDQWRIVPMMIVGCPVTMALVALLALGLGGLVRSTVGGVCALVGLFMILSSVLSVTSLAVSQVPWLGTLSYLMPDQAMASFLSAGVQDSTTAALVSQRDYWVPAWWQSGLIVLIWVALAWIGGLIVTKKADVK